MGNQEGEVFKGPKSALGAGERVKEESSKVWGAGGSQFFACAGFRMLLWCLCLDLGAVPKSSFPFSLPKKRGKGRRGGWAGSREGSCYLPIRGPGQRSALGGLSFAAGADHLLLQLVHDDFPFQILCRARKKKRQGTRGACSETPVAKPNPSDPEMLRNSLWVSAGMQSDGIEVSSQHAGGFLEQGTGTGPPV